MYSLCIFKRQFEPTKGKMMMVEAVIRKPHQHVAEQIAEKAPVEKREGNDGQDGQQFGLKIPDGRSATLKSKWNFDFQWTYNGDTPQPHSAPAPPISNTENGVYWRYAGPFQQHSSEAPLQQPLTGHAVHPQPISAFPVNNQVPYHYSTGYMHGQVPGQFQGQPLANGMYEDKMAISRQLRRMVIHSEEMNVNTILMLPEAPLRFLDFLSHLTPVDSILHSHLATPQHLSFCSVLWRKIKSPLSSFLILSTLASPCP